jgi:hypothetical protein
MSFDFSESEKIVFSPSQPMFFSTLAIKEHVQMENFTKKSSLRNALSSMGEISMNKVGKSTKATFFNLFQCMCFPSPKKPPQAMHSTPIP